MQRCKTTAWPEAERAVWDASTTVKQWGREYALRIGRQYGRFLGFCETLGSEEIGSATKAYEQMLVDRYSPASAATHLLEIFYALSIVRPEEDWAVLRQACRDLRPKPAASPAEPRARPAPLQVPFEAWSPEQQARWLAAFSGGSRRGTFKTRRERAAASCEPESGDPSPGLPPNRWTVAYRIRVARGWGRWLGWARRANAGVELPDAASLSRFVGALETRRNSTVTMASYVWEIYRASEILWPQEDWSWLKEDARVLELEAVPVRSKWQQFAPIDEIFLTGVELMLEAMEEPVSVRSAVKYRDGYLLSFLAIRPKRAKNIREMRLGVHIVMDAEGQPIQLHWSTTKNHDPSTLPYPTALAPFHARWWQTYRPILLGSAPDDGHVWIGHTGKPMGAQGIYDRIRLRTRERLGVEFGAHAIRTDYATSFAAADGRMLSLVQVMLDHRRRTSIKPYQLISEQFSAARTLDEHQRELLERFVSRPRRSGAVAGLP